MVGRILGKWKSEKRTLRWDPTNRPPHLVLITSPQIRGPIIWGEWRSDDVTVKW